MSTIQNPFFCLSHNDLVNKIKKKEILSVLLGLSSKKVPIILENNWDVKPATYIHVCRAANNFFLVNGHNVLLRQTSWSGITNYDQTSTKKEYLFKVD